MNKKLLITALAAANVLSIGTGVTLTAVGSSLAKSQSYNYAAQRWDSEKGCTQLSCFFTDDAAYSVQSLPYIKQSLTDKLKNVGVIAEDGQTLIPEAYSRNAGQMTVTCDRTGRSEAMVTATGGDFFLFRDFKLLDGAFYTESDIMQDGAVIDRMLAWELYGSEDIAGMSLYLNGVKFYISGVIDTPQTKQEKKTAGDMPRVYISYDGYKLLNGGYSEGYDSPTSTLTCYECVVPNPVENFAYNALNDQLGGTYNTSIAIVNNTERFDSSKLAKKYKNLSDYAISDKPLIYPYWENASRITEFRLTGIYHFRKLTYIIPVLTSLLLIVLGWRAGGRLRKKITENFSNSVTKFFYRRSILKEQKKETKNNMNYKEKK